MKDIETSDFKEKTYTYYRGDCPIYERKSFPRLSVSSTQKQTRELALVSNYTNIYICAPAIPIYSPIYFKVITRRVTVKPMIFAEPGP